MRIVISDAASASNLFEAFASALNEAEPVHFSGEDAWAHKKVQSKDEVLKRAKFYFEKEISSLRQLLSSQGMASHVEILVSDDSNRPCAFAKFSLGEPETGYTRYLYAVYNSGSYFYSPKFSRGEYVKFLLYEMRKRFGW